MGEVGEPAYQLWVDHDINRLTLSHTKCDLIMAQVNLDIGDNKITAVITRDELGLKVGDRAIALIKATEVMVIKET